MGAWYRNGFCIDFCDVTACENQIESLRAAIKDYYLNKENEDRLKILSSIKDMIFESGRRYNVNRVFVGYSY